MLRMKTIKTLVLTIALMLTGYAYATADAQSVNDQAKVTPAAACCADHAACSMEDKSCCAEGAACCKEGAACCASGDKADKVTAKVHSHSHDKAAKGGCCAAGSC